MKRNHTLGVGFVRELNRTIQLMQDRGAKELCIYINSYTRQLMRPRNAQKHKGLPVVTDDAIPINVIYIMQKEDYEANKT